MKPAFLAIAAVTAVLLTGLVAPADAQACANVRGADAISPTNLTCRSAQKLARGWVNGFRRDGRANRTVFGFRCRNRPSSVEGDTIVCRRGRRGVRFYPNVR